jgi:hypothetical protein
MTGLVITQAALHAALVCARDSGSDAGIDALVTLLDPTFAAGGAARPTTPQPKRPAPLKREDCPRFMVGDTGETGSDLDELLHDVDWYTPAAIIDLFNGRQRFVVRVAIGGADGELEGHDWHSFETPMDAQAFCVSAKAAPAPPTFHAPSLAAEEAQPAHHDHLPAEPGTAADTAARSSAAEGAPTAPKAPPPAQAAEGHPPKPKQPWGRRPICVWTPERVALLRERLPTCLDDATLLADLNALPAQLPVSSVGSMRKQAVKIGVQREGAVIKQLMQAGARKGLSRANEERLKLLGEEPPPDAKPAKARTYAMTAERLEALPALWTDPSLTAGDIQARLNELPGLRITTSTVLYGWAQKIGLSTHRPQPKDETPAAAEPPPAPPQTSPTPAEPEERTPEEQAAIADQALASKHDRAREKLRQLLADKPKDMSMAAAGIAASMKLPLREVMRLMGEVRAEGQAA